MVQKFVTNMRDKVKSMRKEEEGFSLVELIVVIVILAILIGVTIGGVYKYVNQSRVNTDVNNAATIQSTVSTLGVNKDVYAWASQKDGTTDKEATITIEWTKACAVPHADSDGATWAVTNTTDAQKTTIEDLIEGLLTDGFPAAKAANKFQLKITGKAGNITVKCQALDSSGNALVGQDN